MKTKILTIMISLAMAFTMMPMMGSSVYADDPAPDDIKLVPENTTATPVPYIDIKGEEQSCEDYTLVTDSTSTLIGYPTDGWYVVQGDVEISNRIYVEGSVSLILCDDASLKANGGIGVDRNDSLTIYGQSQGNGLLTAGSSSDSYAAIGGNSKTAGSITICGGTVTAQHSDDAAAIGGGEEGAGGTITITGGTVNATGKDGAAIGGGQDGNSGIITITGGMVNATADEGAAIGAGEWDGNVDTITITGGTVNATGEYGAAIGGGHTSNDDNGGNGGNITIDGGDITATSQDGAGIGAGDAIGGCTNCGNGGNVTINGGTVNAMSTNGAGIGGGYSDGSSTNCGNGGVVTINGGKVNAKSTEAAGIGGGKTDSSNNCGGGAKITLSWTRYSTDSITAESTNALAYQPLDSATVTLNDERPFCYEGTAVPVKSADFSDNAAVNGKTIVPHKVDYTIKYELNGGTNSKDNPDTYTAADTVILAEPTRNGYTFDGWYDNADFRGMVVTQIPENSTGNKTFYAKWTAKPDPVSKSGGMLLAKATAKGKSSLRLSWNRVEGAAGYDIFFARCDHGKKEKECRKIKTIKGNSTFKWTKTGLKKGIAYKAYVRAFVYKNGKKTYVSKSPTYHAFTGKGSRNYTNARSVSLKNVKKGKLTLTKGRTFKIKAKVNKINRKKKLMPKSHAPKLRYLTTDKEVATVSKSGRITAKGSGTCYIYVYAHNGVSKKVKVTVK